MHHAGTLRTAPMLTRATFPQSAQRSYHQTHADFSLPPGLIHAGEDGYASLPQSPLDLAFGGGAADSHGLAANYGACSVDYAGAAPACFEASLVGPGYGALGVVPSYVSAPAAARRHASG